MWRMKELEKHETETELEDQSPSQALHHSHSVH